MAVEVNVSSKEITLEDTLTVTFKTSLLEDETFLATFKLENLEILAGPMRGSSLRTSMINGQLQTQRASTLSYEFKALKSGIAKVYDIVAQIGSKKEKLESIFISISKEKSQSSDLFIKTELSKKSVYLKQGFDLTYYLYNKVAVSDIEIKEFPKLEGFLKRNTQVAGETEQVEYQGQIFERTPIYQMKLFPQKEGTLKIDPIKIQVQIIEKSADLFSGFGFGFGKRKSKLLQADATTLQVKPLPAGAPTSFRGLVGEHDFKIKRTKDHFLVNEAIEIELQILGEGALEDFDFPLLYKDDSLELFDKKSKINSIRENKISKTFEYIYLARQRVQVPALSLVLSFFDPIKNKYIEKKLSLEGMQIEGTSTTESSAPSQVKIPEKKEILSITGTTVLAPYFKQPFILIKAVRMLFFGVLLLCLYLLIPQFKKVYVRIFTPSPLVQKVEKYKKDLKNESLFRTLLEQAEFQQKKSFLTPEAINYFNHLREQISLYHYSSYENKEQLVSIKFEKKYFDELIKVSKLPQ